MFCEWNDMAPMIAEEAFVYSSSEQTRLPWWPRKPSKALAALKRLELSAKLGGTQQLANQSIKISNWHLSSRR